MKWEINNLAALTVIALLAIPFPSSADISQTASFKMSLTIPGVVGINMPIESNAFTTDNLSDNDTGLVKIEEIVTRNGEDVLLQTIVMK